MTRNVESIFGAVVTAPHQIPYTYTATGGETFISLPFYPVTGFITINGCAQVPVENYEIDGNTVNLGLALEADDVVYCLFDKILSPEEYENGIRIYKFQAVGTETSFIPDFTTYGVQTMYIDGKFQVPEINYHYDGVTGVVTFLSGSPAAGVWVVAELSVKQNYPALAQPGGASLVGTDSGITVQQEINNFSVNTREQWRRSLAEAGLTLVDGSFEEGATTNNETDAVWHIAGGQCYTWGGVFPKTVPDNSTPLATGGIVVGAWVGVGDTALRGQLGSFSGLTFNTVGDIFTGTTSSGQTVTLKTGDTVTTGGGTQWRILFDAPSVMSAIKATSPFNVIDFGADPSGSTDSTAAFVSAGGCSVPEGTYIVNDNLSEIYYKDGRVIITGNGTVKLVSRDTLSSFEGTPYDLDASPGGNLYPTAFSSFSANAGEYIRLPVLTRSNYGGETYMAYVAMSGSHEDIGKDPTQTSRAEIRKSVNNLSFGDPVIISTEGEPQASEPAIVFDKKRGRLWATYSTARGKVGLGYGGLGFDPADTVQTWITFANTYGTNWTTPVNITSLVKPYNANTAWVPPSELCITAEGDLIMPFSWYINSEQMYYAGYIRVSENKDGTLSYSRHLIARGGPDGSQGTGEQQIVQLGDGSLFCMMRDWYQVSGNTKGRQRFYRSFDGETWNLVSSIDTSNCKAGLGVFSFTASGFPRNAIMVTAPTGNDDSDLYRNNLKMWISGDYGSTWIEYPTTMFDDPATSTGYSAVISLGNGAFMVAAEGSGYGVMNVKHRAIGAFSGSSVYARSYAKLPIVSSSELAALADKRDIPGYSLYWNNINHTLGINVAGTAIRLSESSDGVDKGAVTTLDADEASIFYMNATTSLRSITTTQNVNRVMLVITSSSQPLTLVEDASVAIANRIRTSRTISTAGAITLWRTKYGWYVAD